MISDYIKEIKEKNTPKNMQVELTTCSHCRHPETKYCLRCEECGREFKDGKLIKEYNGELVNG